MEDDLAVKRAVSSGCLWGNELMDWLMIFAWGYCALQTWDLLVFLLKDFIQDVSAAVPDIDLHSLFFVNFLFSYAFCYFFPRIAK